ncbi:MAG TPA: SLC13 family permease, partial [Aggregatilineales bacterium]|nr:SLC13 family permease [Aggregatilineales bacterium]
MTFPQIFVVAVVLVPLAFVALDRLRIDVAALLIATVLGVAQLLGAGVLGPPNTPADSAKALSGLSQSVVVTLISLFIMTRCLDKTGVTRWLARRVLAISGKSETRLITVFTATTAFLSLFMNNLAAGALVLPSAIDVSRRTGIRASKLLIPVAYGSLLGGVATYFTTANIIVSDLLTTAKPPQAPLHILDFTPTGGLIALAGIAFMAILGRRLLPDHAPKPEQAIARRTGSELEQDYQLGERLWEVQVPAGSRLAGKTLAEAAIGKRLGLTVAAIWHGRQAIFAPTPTVRLHPGDILLTIGREDRVSQLSQEGLKFGRNKTNGHFSGALGVTFVEIL